MSFKVVPVGSIITLGVPDTISIPPGSYSCVNLVLFPDYLDDLGRPYECAQITGTGSGSYTRMFDVPGVGVSGYADYYTCSSYQYGSIVTLNADRNMITFDMRGCDAMMRSYFQRTTPGTGNYRFQYTLQGATYSSERFDLIDRGAWSGGFLSPFVDLHNPFGIAPEEEPMTHYLDDTVTFYAQASKFATGEPFDATGSPAYRVYEESTGTPILTGSMTLLDDSNTAGFYSGQIATTTANGFEVGKTYCVRVQGTIDSVLQAGVVKQFVIRAEPATAATIFGTVDFGDTPGRATTIGGQISQIWRYLYNAGRIANGTHKVMGDDGESTMMQGTVNLAVNDTRRGAMDA